MHFATHFHNWYAQASDAEVARYPEDLALWGVNAHKVRFPISTSGTGTTQGRRRSWP